MTNRDRQFPRGAQPSSSWATNRYPPTRIAGPLDYAKLAAKHRPTDEAALAREVHALAERGLTERDIGAALQLDPTRIRALLESRPMQPGAPNPDHTAGTGGRSSP